MDFADTTTIGIATGLSGFILSAIIAFAKLVWWLSDQFKINRENVLHWLQDHEDKDQHRHEDNLMRFAKVEAKMDILIKNGHKH